jgi:lysophospholipase L1-like esterase
MKSPAKCFHGKKTRNDEKSRSKTFFLVIAIISVLAAVTWAAVQSAGLRIIVIGDSTASTYADTNPLRGWGQELVLFFKNGAVTVLNKAIGGRSSRSFIEDGHWTSTLAVMQKGDYLLISFGTNDRGMVTERHTDTAGFRKYLTQYVTESRAKGAIPILVSTVNQNSWSGSTFTEGFNVGVNDYHGAMLRVVTALTVPFIDLEKKTATLFSANGQSYNANFLFDGGTTHFHEMGAINVAKLVAQGIGELSTNADVAPLAAALAPLSMLTVKSNKTNAGMITKSDTYPESAPITLQVMPNSGETFQQWEDASGKSVSAQTSYKFTMGAAAVTYIAAFKGGTTSVSFARAPATLWSPSVTLSDNGLLSITAHERILSARVSDPSGRCILHCEPNGRHAALDIGSFSHGTYIVSALTSEGLTTNKVQR